VCCNTTVILPSSKNILKDTHEGHLYIVYNIMVILQIISNIIDYTDMSTDNNLKPKEENEKILSNSWLMIFIFIFYVFFSVYKFQKGGGNLLMDVCLLLYLIISSQKVYDFLKVKPNLRLIKKIQIVLMVVWILPMVINLITIVGLSLGWIK
jgi:hypothetical protein